MHFTLGPLCASAHHTAMGVNCSFTYTAQMRPARKAALDMSTG